MSEFARRNREKAAAMAADPDVNEATRRWFDLTSPYEYSYHFRWMGRPIIQYPQDIVAVQQVIWETRPDLIIETGIAHGGSLVLSASILQLLGGDGRVVGIDIDIREHNRVAMEAHPMAKRIHMIEGSSVDGKVIDQVRDIAAGSERVMVMLDSMHSHEHVLRELQAYAPLVTEGCFLIVFDTIVEQMPPDAFPDRPWGRGDNPATAVAAYLATTDRFVVDGETEDPLLITVAPGGYLRCVKS
jgi:cephalosporin hydroxylase